jgi:hypothetical protein
MEVAGSSPAGVTKSSADWASPVEKGYFALNAWVVGSTATADRSYFREIEIAQLVEQ